jgi:HPt (histidine-containing phosphotransfer) domain-containing protein
MRQIFGEIGDEVRELLQLFLDSTQPLVEDLDKALAAGDVLAAREAAHSAKGAGNSAGAFRFAKLCGEVESACARGDAEAAIQLLEPLRQAFVEVSAAVAEV